MSRKPIFAATLAAVLAGCGPGAGPSDPEPALGASSQAATAVGDADSSAADPKESQALNGTLVEANAPILKGCEISTSLRGAPLPFGCSNNGPLRSSPLAWVRLDGATARDGSAVTAARLEGTLLTGVVHGVTVSGKALEGVELSGVATSGAAVRVRLERVEEGHHHQEDVWRYEFSYLDAKGDWKRLCKENNRSVVVSGRWDYHQGVAGDGAKTNDPTVFTIGCRRSAIEKCINGGYKPWVAQGTSTLDEHHQACVRMMRADYCGDGVAHTTPGRKLNLYDRLGLQVDDEPWVTEAEWTAAGARCLNTLNLTPEDAPCLGALGTPVCGQASRLASDTLLISETPKLGGRDGL